jgi:hypothetical protein
MNPHEVVMGEVERHSSLQFDSFLLKALVNRVKRRIYIRMVRRGDAGHALQNRTIHGADETAGAVDPESLEGILKQTLNA